MKASKAYMGWLLVSPSPLPHLWPVFSNCPSFSHTGLAAVWIQQGHARSQPFYCFTHLEPSFFLSGLFFVSQGPAQVLPSHRGIYSTAAQCPQESTLYFPCPLLLGFQVVIQVRPSDTPHEVCEMSVGPQEAESACDKMLLFLLDFHVAMASVADVQLSVACVHIQQ